MTDTIRRVFRSIHFRYHGAMGWLSVDLSEAVCDGAISAFGRPIIIVCPGSSIQLGSGAMLISKSFATVLGVNHPVVLRTLLTGAKIAIGKRVGISGGSICAAHLVDIGEDTLLGANVTVADTDFHSTNPYHRSGHSGAIVCTRDVVIGKRVFIGTNSIVLKGTTIGDNSVIGVGSVITGQIPENVVAAGNPCRLLRHFTPEEMRP